MGGVKEASMVNDSGLEEASRALKALSHPIRLKILCVLADGIGEIPVQEIVTAIDSSQSNISQHLSIMRDKGLITARKQGNRVMYSIGDERMFDLFNMMRDLFRDD